MRGRNIMMGYLNKPDKTAVVFDESPSCVRRTSTHSPNRLGQGQGAALHHWSDQGAHHHRRQREHSPS